MSRSHDVIPMPSEVADIFDGGGELGTLTHAARRTILRAAASARQDP
jgi:hypothetical protein